MAENFDNGPIILWDSLSECSALSRCYSILDLATIFATNFVNNKTAFMKWLEKLLIGNNLALCDILYILKDID